MAWQRIRVTAKSVTIDNQPITGVLEASVSSGPDGFQHLTLRIVTDASHLEWFPKEVSD